MKTKKSQKIESLVVKAIRRLQDVQGSSPREISNYISQEYNVSGPDIRKSVQLALKHGETFGILQRLKGGNYTYNQHYMERHPMESGDMSVEMACCRRRMKRRKSRCGSRRRSSRRRKSRRGHCRSRSRKSRRRSRSRRSRRRSRSRKSRRGSKRKCSSRRSRRRSRRRKRRRACSGMRKRATNEIGETEVQEVNDDSTKNHNAITENSSKAGSSIISNASGENEPSKNESLESIQ